jgi:hypothetical protein
MTAADFQGTQDTEQFGAACCRPFAEQFFDAASQRTIQTAVDRLGRRKRR